MRIAARIARSLSSAVLTTVLVSALASGAAATTPAAPPDLHLKVDSVSAVAAADNSGNRGFSGAGTGEGSGGGREGGKPSRKIHQFHIPHKLLHQIDKHQGAITAIPRGTSAQCRPGSRTTSRMIPTMTSTTNGRVQTTHRAHHIQMPRSDFHLLITAILGHNCPTENAKIRATSQSNTHPAANPNTATIAATPAMVLSVPG